jgi:hypothetical protein
LRRERDRAARALRAGWTILALLTIAAVAVTHHLTAYALVAALWAVVVISLITRGRAQPAPWDLAAFATLVVGGWYVFVASPTGSYLSGTLGFGLQSVLRLLTLQQLPRQLFDASSSFGVAPALWQILVAFAATLFVAIGVVLGVRPWWQRSRLQSIGILLGLAGLAYVPLQILRLTPASWETANRSSGFVFAGVGFVLALVLVGVGANRGAKVRSLLQSLGLVTYAMVIFLGGVVLSWRTDVRLPRPYYTETMGYVMEPQGIAVATWSREYLGEHNSVAASDADAFLLATYGQQRSWTGFARGIRAMLFAPEVNPSVRLILAGVEAEYVVVDRRLQSFDLLAGYYPAPGPDPLAPSQLLDPIVSNKFDSHPDVSRIADTGDIVVYDVSRLSGVATASTNN